MVRATSAEPLEVRFRSRDWTGGVIVTGDNAITRRLVRHFLRTSPAAGDPRPIYAVGGSATAVNHTLGAYDGKRSTRAQFLRSHATTQSVTPSITNPAGGCPPDSDCDEWVNKDGYEPGVPQHGQLRQLRMQGVIESSDHTIRDFSKRGYSAVLHHVSMTNGHGGRIKPTYGYEHDYKVTNNGYVTTTPNYDWSTNLPGAYRDTRASDSSSKLDFTVGTLFTWLLDSAKIYQIRTTVPSPQSNGGKPTSSTALLTGQILPNDGSFDASTAAAGSGCSFVVDPTGGNTVPSQDSHNYAWCTGVGHGLGSQKAAYSYISTSPFSIKYDGTCRNWTLGAGAVNCP